jgi:hypothetical protein
VWHLGRTGCTRDCCCSRLACSSTGRPSYCHCSTRPGQRCRISSRFRGAPFGSTRRRRVQRDCLDSLQGTGCLVSAGLVSASRQHGPQTRAEAQLSMRPLETWSSSSPVLRAGRHVHPQQAGIQWFDCATTVLPENLYSNKPLTPICG